jgi:hypothetical protein
MDGDVDKARRSALPRNMNTWLCYWMDAIMPIAISPPSRSRLEFGPANASQHDKRRSLPSLKGKGNLVAMNAPGDTSMMQRVRVICLGLLTSLAIAGFAGQAAAAPAERFVVTSLKAVRPNIVNMVSALQQKNLARAKAAYQAYDSAWNGIEVYINTRNKDVYNLLELDLQARISKGLTAPMPDFATLTTDAQTLLAKYDDAVKMVAGSPPLNALYDDIARLRIVRAPLREVVPDLKDGKVAEARKSYEAFDSKWDSIEDLIKARSEDAYVAIEKGMIQLEQALMPDKPDVAQVTALVTTVNTQYNAALAEVTKEARAAK